LSSLDKTTNDLDANLVSSYCAQNDGSTGYIDCGAIETCESGCSSFEVSMLVVGLTGTDIALCGEYDTGGDKRGWYVYVGPSYLRLALGKSDGTFNQYCDFVYPDPTDIENQILKFTFNESGLDGIVKCYLDDVQIGSAQTVTGQNKIYSNGANFALYCFFIGGAAFFSSINQAALAKVKVNNSIYLPLQGSTYDISGNENHGTVNGSVALNATQDIYHWNITKGYSRYSDGTDNLFVPYDMNRQPLSITPPAGFSLVQECLAGYWHNGAETKLVLGATYNATTGNWETEASVIAADTEGHLHNTSTGFALELGYDDLVAVFTGDYLFCDVQTDYQYKNLLLYSTAPTYGDSVSVHKYIRYTDFVTNDDDGSLVFDADGFIVTDDEVI